MQPQVLGPYRLGRKLGEGGMGAVYAAVDNTGRAAAVKILPPHLFQRSGFRARFQIEIETLRKLNHPNIVQFYGFGEQADTLYYAMELVEGRSLEGIAQDGRRFHWREVLSIGYQSCRALKHAHDRGIVHRDIKPANLMLTPDDQIKLSDFGIAKLWGNSGLTLDGGPIGTANYMSPEQAEGKRASERSDLYSLGCMFYSLLANRPPFVSNSLVEMLHMQRYVVPDPIRRHAPGVPVEFERVIATLLEKDPEKRVPNAAVLSRLLKAVEEANPAGQDLPEPRSRVAAGTQKVDDSSTPIFDAFDIGAESDNPPEPDASVPNDGQTGGVREVGDSMTSDPRMDRSAATLPGTSVRATRSDEATLDSGSVAGAIGSLGDVTAEGSRPPRMAETRSDDVTLDSTTRQPGAEKANPPKSPGNAVPAGTFVDPEDDDVASEEPMPPVSNAALDGRTSTLSPDDQTLVTAAPVSAGGDGGSGPKVFDATSIAEVAETNSSPPTLLPGMPKGRKGVAADARHAHDARTQGGEATTPQDATKPYGGQPTLVDDTPALGRYVTAEEAEANEAEAAPPPEPNQISLSSILAGLALVVIVAVGWWFTKPLSANEMYDRIQAAAKDSDPERLDDAMTNILDFQRLYKDDPRAAEVAKIHETLEVNKLERRMAIRSARAIDPSKQLPIERAYLEAMSVAGPTPDRAVAKLRALITLFSPNASTTNASNEVRLFVLLAERQAERLSRQVSGFTDELTRQLDQAEKICHQDPEKARTIIASVAELATNKPWGKPLLERVALIASALPPVPVPTSAPSTAPSNWPTTVPSNASSATPFPTPAKPKP